MSVKNLTKRSQQSPSSYRGSVTLPIPKTLVEEKLSSQIDNDSEDYMMESDIKAKLIKEVSDPGPPEIAVSHMVDSSNEVREIEKTNGDEWAERIAKEAIKSEHLYYRSGAQEGDNSDDQMIPKFKPSKQKFNPRSRMPQESDLVRAADRQPVIAQDDKAFVRRTRYPPNSNRKAAFVKGKPKKQWTKTKNNITTNNNGSRQVLKGGNQGRLVNLNAEDLLVNCHGDDDIKKCIRELAKIIGKLATFIPK